MIRATRKALRTMEPCGPTTFAAAVRLSAQGEWGLRAMGTKISGMVIK